MAPQTPYTKDLAGREPAAAMRDNADRYRRLLADWTAALFERTYAPGKWTARQILIHLAQTELALGTRARMALTTPNYAAQSFNQDRWMEIESGPERSRGSSGSGGSSEPGGPGESSRSGGASGGLSGAEARDALLALMAMNRTFFEGLSPAELGTSLSHPEYGQLTVDWILHQMAGHQIHHLQQLEQIARL